MTTRVYIRAGHWVGRLGEIVEQNGDEVKVDIVNADATTTLDIEDVRVLD